ncbi:hypothetical protein HKO22_02070 [Peptoniphilus sp. AGMB00490]|uniref:Uncharacterized protein n=1 Tax=Peptoniphilus faecalis TaxID=2731255 RepID=A0A848RGG6_9FIRM|nr:hypothetical protein [Peptoniphilus faecalis]NMW84529.1 hypothetical protein [Peptoniphilus faecalis]
MTVLLFLNFFEFYKNEDLVNYECTNIQILGSENNIRTIALNDKGKNVNNEINLNINFSTNKELLFNTVLINNFENKRFSINELKSSNIQRIKFPETKKASSNNLIKTENTGLNLNDYILIFLGTKQNKIDIIKHFRFTVQDYGTKSIQKIEPTYTKNLYRKIKKQT